MSLSTTAVPTIYLLDANVLLRMAQSTHSQHATARGAARTANRRRATGDGAA